jgi:Zn-dependent protease
LTDLPPIDLPSILIAFLVLIFSLTVHESAHAWTADQLGDDTARRLGRVSLNPLVHIDPIGTVLFPLLAIVGGLPVIGWAKPTPVNVGRLHRPRRDNALVTAAGPASNLLIAMSAALAFHLIPAANSPVGDFDIARPVLTIIGRLIDINLLLALFNLIPVLPLDGGNIVLTLLPPKLAYRYAASRSYGMLILYALMLTGALGYLLGPPYYFLRGLLR